MKDRLRQKLSTTKTVLQYAKDCSIDFDTTVSDEISAKLVAKRTIDGPESELISTWINYQNIITWEDFVQMLVWINCKTYCCFMKKSTKDTETKLEIRYQPKKATVGMVYYIGGLGHPVLVLEQTKTEIKYCIFTSDSNRDEGMEIHTLFDLGVEHSYIVPSLLVDKIERFELNKFRYLLLNNNGDVNKKLIAQIKEFIKSKCTLK